MVANDQSCGVPGCYIGENVAFLRDAVQFATTFDSPVAILSLDQEKAFDRVDWGFMSATRFKMGFGVSFLDWVKLLYTGVQSAVNVNGYLSSFFSLSHGVRQGCPVSPLLYVLVAEVLAVNIRANPVSKALLFLIVLRPCLPSLSMLTIRLLLSLLMIRSWHALRLMIFMRRVLVRSSTCPSLRACGLVCGEIVDSRFP